jgi:hypothetical protein
MKQDIKTGAFKSFPEFARLTFDQREVYEAIADKYPPIADLSFSNLMNFWGSYDGLFISELNGNLVISYWLPGLEKYSGLALIGTRKIDESISTIFDHQKNKGEKPRITNVPEFVVQNIRYPELFTLKEERALSECIIDIKKFYPLEGMINHRKWAVKRYLSANDSQNIEVKSIDLSTESNKELLLDKVKELKGKRGAINNTYAIEQQSIVNAITNADLTGMENVCLFVRGELQAFCLYDLPADEDYLIIGHARISYELAHGFDYAVYAFAKWFAEHDIKYVNLEADLGFMGMRILKVVLGPSNFFRKYAIKPAG